MSRAVERITVMLEVLATQERPSSLSDVAIATGLDKSTVFRFLRACERQQIVRRDPDTLRYSLGIRIIEWGGHALDKIDVAKAADPVLARLNLETRETVVLYVREGQRRTAVAIHNSPRLTVVALRLGWTVPLPLGAAGKIFLAHMTQEEIRETLDSASDLDHTVKKRVESELPEIRRTGYAVSSQETSDHAWSVAAPIYGARGHVVAALAVSAPGNRHSPEIQADFVERVVVAADEVSRMIGAV